MSRISSFRWAHLSSGMLKSLSGDFSATQSKKFILLCFIVQTLEQWQHIHVLHCRLLKNEFFSNLLEKHLQE